MSTLVHHQFTAKGSVKYSRILYRSTAYWTMKSFGMKMFDDPANTTFVVR